MKNDIYKKIVFAFWKNVLNKRYFFTLRMAKTKKHFWHVGDSYHPPNYDQGAVFVELLGPVVGCIKYRK